LLKRFIRSYLQGLEREDAVDNSKETQLNREYNAVMERWKLDPTLPSSASLISTIASHPTSSLEVQE
jgi:hypothetical protein